MADGFHVAAAAFFSRCVWTVLIRATSRRLRRSSLGASSRSVCCLMRRRNKFSFASLSVSPSCSSLMSRSSTALAISISRDQRSRLYVLTLSLHHAYADRHLVSQPRVAHLCCRLGHATQFIQDCAWTNHGRPKLRFTL